MDDEEDKEGGGQEVQVVSLLLRHVVFFGCMYVYKGCLKH